MEAVLDLIKDCLTENTMSALANSFNVLDREHQLRGKISAAFPTISFDEFSKMELHQIFEFIIINQFQGEATFKAALAKRYFGDDSIVAFEVKALASRLDFLRVNGWSYAYEIKSGRDSLIRLPKQICNYIELFEYVTLCIPEEHISTVKKLIPECVGILIWDGSCFKEIIKATYNDKTNSVSQLNALTKKERYAFFGEDGSIDRITSIFSSSDIRQLFKDALKRRYSKRWNHLTSSKDLIFECDYEFFFQVNIDPSIIYR